MMYNSKQIVKLSETIYLDVLEKEAGNEKKIECGIESFVDDDGIRRGWRQNGSFCFG